MIIRMIAERGLADRTEYITFSRHAYDALFLSAMEPDVVKATGGAGADFNISVYRKNPTWIGLLHEQGMPVNVWTVDKEEDLLWCIGHGVDMITTNEPELAKEMISKRHSATRQE